MMPKIKTMLVLSRPIPDEGIKKKTGCINGPNNERFSFRIDLDKIVEIRNDFLSDLRNIVARNIDYE